MKEFKTGYVATEVYQVKQYGNSYKLMDTKGTKVGVLNATSNTRKTAFQEGKAIQAYVMANGKKIYKKVDMDVFNSLVVPMDTGNGKEQNEGTKDHDAVKDFIHNGSVALRPRELVMKDLKWKYLIRSAVRAKNIMMTGLLVVVKLWLPRL